MIFSRFVTKQHFVTDGDHVTTFRELAQSPTFFPRFSFASVFCLSEMENLVGQQESETFGIHLPGFVNDWLWELVDKLRTNAALSRCQQPRRPYKRVTHVINKSARSSQFDQQQTDQNLQELTNDYWETLQSLPTNIMPSLRLTEQSVSTGQTYNITNWQTLFT